MSAKQQAVKDLKKLAVTFSGILSLADDLEHLGSLEQGVEEAESRMRVLKAEQQELESSLDVCKRDIQTAQDEAKASREATREQADALLTEARRTAIEIQDSAHADAKATADEAAGHYEAMQEKTAAARLKLADLEAVIADRQKQLEALNKRIATVKEAVAGI